MTARKILVTGATGNQGSAVVDALLAKPPAFPHEIVGLTRNAQSDAAQKLRSKSDKVNVISGNLNDCPAIFKSTGGPGSIWGVFSLQAGGAAQKGASENIEEKQGMGLVDAAIEAGVQHFVYSSVDRGGSNSINDPTNVPHFISKHNIEKHLIAAVEDAAKNKQKMTYTILRPVAFFENLVPGFMGKTFASMWSKLGPDHPLQHVSTRDIGIFAAKSFAAVGRDPLSPSIVSSDPDPYRNSSISLAGDELTQAQGSAIFEKVFGQPMPITFGFVGSAVLYMVKEMGIMFRWFREVGYKADIARCRELNPEMRDFETWLKTESGFANSQQK